MVSLRLKDVGSCPRNPLFCPSFTAQLLQDTTTWHLVHPLLCGVSTRNRTEKIQHQTSRLVGLTQAACTAATSQLCFILAALLLVDGNPGRVQECPAHETTGPIICTVSHAKAANAICSPSRLKWGCAWMGCPSSPCISQEDGPI